MTAQKDILKRGLPKKVLASRRRTLVPWASNPLKIQSPAAASSAAPPSAGVTCSTSGSGPGGSGFSAFQSMGRAWSLVDQHSKVARVAVAGSSSTASWQRLATSSRGIRRDEPVASRIIS